jgi:hypothetical protein
MRLEGRQGLGKWVNPLTLGRKGSLLLRRSSRCPRRTASSHSNALVRQSTSIGMPVGTDLVSAPQLVGERNDGVATL